MGLSALSLRVFSEDITAAGQVNSQKQKNEKSKQDEDMAETTPVPEGSHEEQTEGAESTPD